MEFDPKEIERQMMEGNSWTGKGEVKASNRPINSLVNVEADFPTNVINIPITKDENSTIIKYITQRFREKTFDNYEFKEKPVIVEEEIYDEKLIESSKEIFEIYNKIESEIKKMMEF
jgi:U3 small nucleolar RNA-associated protein MPP10